MNILTNRTKHFLKAVLFSPGRLINAFLIWLAYLARARKVIGQPVVLDIEPTNACNFRCAHCQVTHADWVKKNLEEGDFIKYLDNFPLALRVKLQGMGEPFLNKNLINFVEIVCKRGIWCEVISNGSLWHQREMARLDKFRNFELIVSLDAAERAVFEKVRTGSDFDRIIENIRWIKRMTNINLSAWIVVVSGFQDQLEKLIPMLNSLGIRDAGIQMLVGDFGKKELDHLTIKQRVTASQSDVLRSRARYLAKTNGVNLGISDFLYSKKRPCPWPWMGVFVDVSGNIVPCCRIGDASISCMGNLRESDFSKIWNSDAYQEFRGQHKDGKIPAFCSNCYENNGLGAPI